MSSLPPPPPQGEYLSELLSRTNGDVCSQPVTSLEAKGLSPFKYRHLGSFAYVGDNKAVLQLPIIGTYTHTHTICDRTVLYRSRGRGSHEL